MSVKITEKQSGVALFPSRHQTGQLSYLHILLLIVGGNYCRLIIKFNRIWKRQYFTAVSLQSRMAAHRKAPNLTNIHILQHTEYQVFVDWE